MRSQVGLKKCRYERGSRGDGILAELFQTLKHDAVKVLHSYDSNFGKLSNGHGTRRGQFSFQSQRRAMAKNVQSTTQLHSLHVLAGNAQNPPG